MEIHNQFIDSLGPSRIREITSQINEKVANGKEVAHFASGRPSAEYFPVKELKDITSDIFEEEGGNALQYAPSSGFQPLKKGLVKYMSRFGVTTNEENIQIYEGSTQALSYITRSLFTFGSGAIVVEQPSYTGALDMFKTLGAQLVEVKMDDDGINIEQLESVLKTHDVKFIYTICDFQNPSGRRMSVEKRKQIVALAKLYNTIIVEDAPYSLLSFNGDVYPAIKSFDTSDNVIYIGSFSKVIAPGIRIGWSVGNEQFTKKMVYLKMIDDLQVNNLSQRQVRKYILRDDFETHLNQVRMAYFKKMELMVSAIRESFPKGTKFVEPEGGLFLWVELPETIDTEKLFPIVFEEDIAYLPGNRFFAFGDNGRNCMRLSFATARDEIITEKIKRLGEILNRYL